MTKQLRQSINTPTHALVTDGAEVNSNLGYVTLSQLKQSLGLPSSLVITTSNPVNGSVPVWQNGQLTISDQTTTQTLTDAGNF